MSLDAERTTSSPQFTLTRPMLIILITVFLNIMGLGLILPVLPFYATAYGADATQVGLLFTAFAAMQFLTSPAFGALSDRLGRRPIILFGLFGQMSAYVLLGFANTLALLFAARILSGATAGNISASSAYVADITPWQGRTRAYGLMGAAFGAGLLFGPALGGVLTLIDPRAPAFGAAALVALNLLFGLVMLPESLPPKQRSERPFTAGQLNPLGVLVPLARRPVLRGPLVAIFLLNIVLTGFQANLAVFAAAQFSLGPTAVAELFVVAGLANIVVQAILVPRLSKRFSDAALIVIGVAMNAAGDLATGFAPAATVFWGSVPLLSGGYNLTRGPLTSMVSKLVAPTEQGMANGGVQATISLAGVVGPLMVGVVFVSVGQSSPYWISAILAVVAAVAIALRARSRPAPVAVPATPAVAGQPEPSGGPVPALLATPPRPNGAVLAAPGPAAPTAAVAPPIAPEASATGQDTLVAMLYGSLAGIGLPPILHFLGELDKRGQVLVWRDGWRGTIAVEHGQIVTASFRKEHGLAALDAILMVLSNGYFAFAEGEPDPPADMRLDLGVSAVQARLAGLPLGAALHPRTVPAVIQLAEQPGTADLVLSRGTLQTLLAIDGMRTVEEIGDRRGLTRAIHDVLTLLEQGLIGLDGASSGAAPQPSELPMPDRTLSGSAV